MSASLNKKHLLLGVAGVAAFAAAYWLSQLGDPELAVVQAVSRASNPGKPARPAAAPQTQTTPPSTLQTPGRSPVSFENQKDIFAPHSWLPPPPPQAAAPAPAPPPAPPMAPPLPFSFFGALDEKGLARRVFLTKGDQLVIVKANDIVEGQYRVDRITESAVDLTYLPLNQKQSISIQQGGL